MRVYISIKLHITAQSGPAILISECYARNRSYRASVATTAPASLLHGRFRHYRNVVCVCLCEVITFSKLGIDRLCLVNLIVASWAGQIGVSDSEEMSTKGERRGYVQWSTLAGLHQSWITGGDVCRVSPWCDLWSFVSLWDPKQEQYVDDKCWDGLTLVGI